MLSIKELPRIIRFLPKIVLAVIVTTCDEVYKKIAYWLNDMGAWGSGAIWGGARGLDAGTPPQNSPPRLRRELPPAECLRETPHHQNRPGKGVDGERGCGGGHR